MDEPQVRKMHFCPCCGQQIGMMSYAIYHLWLSDVERRLRRENKPELAEALAAFTAAIEGHREHVRQGDVPGEVNW